MTTSDSRRWQWLAVALLVGLLVWRLSPILTPFVISALFGWLGDPLVDRLEARGYKRHNAVLMVFAVMLVALTLVSLVLVPLLWSQLQKLIDWLPLLVAWTTSVAIPWIQLKFKVDLSHYVDPEYMFTLVQEHLAEAGGIAAAVLGRVSESGLALFGMLASIALIPVLSFYFLRDWDVMVRRIRELVPRPMLPTVDRLGAESNAVLGGFLRGQFSVMLALGAIYAIGLWSVGLELGLLIGFVSGLVAFVPYLGFVVGISAAVVASLVQYGDLVHLLLVFAVFGIGQMLESFLLTPWLVGDKIGLHPVAVIFAIMAGGQLFGFLGVLLALPVAAIGMVLLRHVHQRYTGSVLYGARGGPVGIDLGLPDPGIIVVDDADAPPSSIPPVPPVTPP